MYSVIIPILMGIIRLKRLHKPFILIFIYVIISFLSDFGGNLFTDHIDKIHRFFRISQFILVFLTFYIGARTSRLKNLIGLVFLIFCLIAFANAFIAKDQGIFGYNFRTISTIGLIILSIISLIDLYQSEKTIVITENPMFWLAAGFLLYFSGNLFLFSARQLFTSNEVINFYYPIHSTLNTLKNLIIGYSFYQLVPYKKKVEQIHGF